MTLRDAGDEAAASEASRGRRPAWLRLPLLLVAFVALFIGIGAGLVRLGWSMPALAVENASLHGPLMICGFFGVVIGIERAVALGRVWAYGGPLIAGLGTVAAIHGAIALAPWLYLTGSAVLLGASLAALRRQPAWFTATIVLGAACWSIGTARWALGAEIHQVLGWWLAFLVLTIAGERLELSRFLPRSAAAGRVFAIIVAVLLIALLAWSRSWGQQLAGSALVALAAWLARHDIARRTVRQRGLTRFIAVSLLSGYVWLGVAGAVMTLAGLRTGTAAYDAALHALLLGFVFAMVFGHAPIIFPAVLRIAVPYHPVFYAPLGVLHLSVVVRVVGDATGEIGLTRGAGFLSACALLAFVVSTASAVVRARVEPRRREAT